MEMSGGWAPLKFEVCSVLPVASTESLDKVATLLYLGGLMEHPPDTKATTSNDTAIRNLITILSPIDDDEKLHNSYPAIC
jgi:hypothetical protein